ncbi:Hypothetical predicted protein [Marmota monax]|uniref:INTS8 TPR repeats domain-containing protein n=1 Tax=Marmota monax TaxID=9995 RepID=A0A5E4CNT2_MARMO|nr:hypothetical protein GHT09_010866 [Marmota monax]VTJ83455.1 Hypothetical predicted protein [Marmota monax]
MTSNSLSLFTSSATNQYSAALHYYLQAGAVCSDFFNKAVPPDVYTDQVIKRMIKCCSLLNCHTQVAILCQFLREIDYKTAFKSLQEQNSHDAMDSYYDYIWDVTILEYLTCILPSTYLILEANFYGLDFHFVYFLNKLKTR